MDSSRRSAFAKAISSSVTGAGRPAATSAITAISDCIFSTFQTGAPSFHPSFQGRGLAPGRISFPIRIAGTMPASSRKSPQKDWARLRLHRILRHHAGQDQIMTPAVDAGGDPCGDIAGKWVFLLFAEDMERLLDGELVEAVHPPIACADHKRAAVVGDPNLRLGVRDLFDTDEDSHVIHPCRLCDQAGPASRRFIAILFRPSRKRTSIPSAVIDSAKPRPKSGWEITSPFSYRSVSL